MMLILVQLALLLLTAWGWGFWLWKISDGPRRSGWQRFGWFFFGLGGYAACILFLHALIFLNLPLHLTSWVALLVAAAGALGSWSTRSAEPLDISSGRRERLAAGVIFAAVFASQGAPLFHAGPQNYYGNAHTDQVNYVLLAEFLAEKPFSTSVADVGLQPWLAKPVDLKVERIGQCAANGYLGVITLVDAKRAYGTISIFLVALGALSVFVLARVLSVPRLLATLTGIWWGVLPAVTKMHLDGFFSQVSVLFVFPAIAALFYLRGAGERRTLLLLTLYLSYLLCVYTEVYVIGVGLLVSLCLLAARTATPWWRRLATAAAVVVGSLLLAGGYLRIFFHFVAHQYHAADNSATLGGLTPMGGTWIGWKQVFFGYETPASAPWQRASLLLGLALVFAVSCAFQGRSLAKRRFLLAMAAPPLGILALLLSAPTLAKYPFSKLVDTFTPFWLVLIAIGLLHLGGLWGRAFRWGRALTHALVFLLAATALGGSWAQWRAVCLDQDPLIAEVDSPAARRCYAVAQSHPEGTYLITEPQPILCAWLAYAARHSKVYVDDSIIADLPVPASTYAFRRPPPITPTLTILDDKGPRLLTASEGEPNLVVRNPQGIDGGGADTWYWIGPPATLEITDFLAPAGSSRRFALGFDALAGPANPDPARRLTLRSPDGSVQTFDFVSQAEGRFEIEVRPGKNVFVLEVTHPTEQTVKIPTDPRNHMVRLQHLTLTKPSSSGQGVPPPAPTPVVQ